MGEWLPPQRPAEYAEKSLIQAILNGEYPAGKTLPAERDLAARLGVTRPTLREALQRLERDGWLTIQQGKSTRVNDYWREGGLNVLNALVQYSENLPHDFVPNLVEVRLVLAPVYTCLAVQNSPSQVLKCLESQLQIEDTPEAYASFDWQLHHTLTVASGNPIFTLILNGFASFYKQMARIYFRQEAARKASGRFYKNLSDAVKLQDSFAAEEITRNAMNESVRMWETGAGGQP